MMPICAPRSCTSSPFFVRDRFLKRYISVARFQGFLAVPDLARSAGLEVLRIFTGSL